MNVLSLQRVTADLEEATRELSLYPVGLAPVPSPIDFLTGMCFSLPTKTLENLVLCYQDVYGSSERNKKGEIIWGEGAYCSLEGWSNTLPLDEFMARQKDGNVSCSCGGEYTLCFPGRNVERLFKRNMSEGFMPFYTTMDGDCALRIAGFAWGAVCTAKQIADRLVLARYNGHADECGKKLAAGLVDSLKNYGIQDQDMILFFDEVALHERFRRGLDPVQFLVRPGFEIGSLCTHQVLFWTSRRSPIYTLASWMGFMPIYEAAGLVYLYMEDYFPFLKILQNWEWPKILFILKNNARVLRNR